MAVFRCDASAAIGSGHAVRCLTLAAALEQAGWRSALATPAESLGVVPALGRHPRIDPDASAPADLLVVDHYRLDAAYEGTARAWARRILVLDDLADRTHDCDLLLDQTLGRHAADYRPLVPPGCRVLTGPAFALLRPDFASLRGQALERRRGVLKRVLVAFGGTDPGNATGLALAGIAASGLDLAVDVVLGQAAPHLEAVRASLPANATLHVGTARMAELMLDADLAIGAGGSSAWERCCLGLPALMMVIADNQRAVTAALERAGAALALGDAASLSAAAVADALGHLDAGGLATMAAAGFGICDGMGAGRLARVLAGDGAGVLTVRPAEERDGAILYGWKNEPAALANSLSRTLVPWADHRAWFVASLTGDRRRIFMIERDGAALGAVRFDLGDCRAVVSLVLAPESRGLGLGAEVLRLGVEAFLATHSLPLDARIRIDNAPSLKVFARNGFVPGGDTDGVVTATRLP
ncbi:UDP-2,4-diacetamido-2,4,6-trideoxy-beta-L-altropyranose hydrolase [Magnetospirillum sp. UT-4]|uniref:UDP-2,4-diacetamido-2,4, 6-trideoxy-beta-L-altropyranose hydrolase n=1 Tax=Magnetospirillum sp. UT-4 TaxID=2681467 RepID=UPI0020C2D908|nr:UDP-2,4-diacetamido-2,4,6-trideoxy-beta-L-altropyranose hydrolase [Magnetospirillum sp. UT-4]